jgi:hypothetical protein
VRRSKLRSGVDERLDQIGLLVRDAIQRPQRERRPGQPLDLVRCLALTVRRELPGGGVARRGELLRRDREQLIDDILDCGLSLTSPL